MKCSVQHHPSTLQRILIRLGSPIAHFLATIRCFHAHAPYILSVEPVATEARRGTKPSVLQVYSTRTIYALTAQMIPMNAASHVKLVEHSIPLPMAAWGVARVNMADISHEMIRIVISVKHARLDNSTSPPPHTVNHAILAFIVTMLQH